MKWIFIGGTGRSGTTLVHKLLLSHSKISGGPEFDHSRRIARLYDIMSSEFALSRQSFYYSSDELKKSFTNFYESLFNGVISSSNAEWISEKTPANIDAAGSLLRLFDDAVFVCVVRDGRDVYASHKKVYARLKNKHPEAASKQKKDFSLRTIAKYWLGNSGNYLDLANDPKNDRRLHLIRYEDLVTHPQESLEELCQFLGLNFEPQLLAESVQMKNLDALAVNADDVWYSRKQLSKKISEDSLGRWKLDLSPFEKAAVSLLMCERLGELGYSSPATWCRIKRLLNLIRGR